MSSREGSAVSGDTGASGDAGVWGDAEVSAHTELADDRVFKALASGVRRRMLDILKGASLTTGELCARLPELDRTTVLQHLRVLERAELVSGRRVGRERHLSLSPLPFKRINDRWIGQYMTAAVDLLEQLDGE